MRTKEGKAVKRNKWHGDREGEWRLDLKRLRRGIVVHRWVGLTDQWFVSCYDLGISRQALLSKEIEGARAEALAVLRDFLVGAAEELVRVAQQEPTAKQAKRGP